MSKRARRTRKRSAFEADEINKRLNNSRAAKTPKVKADKVIVHKVFWQLCWRAEGRVVGRVYPFLVICVRIYIDI